MELRGQNSAAHGGRCVSQQLTLALMRRLSLRSSARTSDTNLVVGAEVLVFLHQLQLLVPPHQDRPHLSTRQVGVELRRKYVDSS